MHTNAVYIKGVLYAAMTITTGQLISFPGEQAGCEEQPMYLGVAGRRIDAGKEINYNPLKNTKDVLLKMRL